MLKINLFSVGITAIFVVLLSTVYQVFQFQKFSRLKVENKGMEQKIEVLKDEKSHMLIEEEKLRDQIDLVQKETVQLKEKMEEMKKVKELASVSRDPSPEKVKSSRSSRSKKNEFLENAKEVMKNPEMQKVVKGQWEVLYAPLFSKLNLSEEKRKEFLDVALAPMLGKPIEDGEEKIKKILGDSGYQQYQIFQETMNLQMAANDLQMKLAATPTPLQDIQYKQIQDLIDADYHSHPKQKYPVTMDADGIQKWIQSEQEMYQRIANQSALFLTPEQQKVFASSLDAQLAAVEAAGKVGAKFIQDKKK